MLSMGKEAYYKAYYKRNRTKILERQRLNYIKDPVKFRLRSKFNYQHPNRKKNKKNEEALGITKIICDKPITFNDI